MNEVCRAGNKLREMLAWRQTQSRLMWPLLPSRPATTTSSGVHSVSLALRR